MSADASSGHAAKERAVVKHAVKRHAVKRHGDLALIDAGGANLGSVRYALQRIGAQPRLVRDADELGEPARILLPGVGAAAPSMALLRERGLDIALRASTVPLLGVCVGMQLLFESSDEGDVRCLGLLPGRVRKLADGPGVRVPHMGWNRLRKRTPPDPTARTLLDGIDDGAYVYFVHSYAVLAEDGAAYVLADTEHGGRFAAVVGQGLRFGAQFHPERSAAVGLRLLANFLKLPT
ncbi:MAG: imidazole glycerol phosphate synthase subunit HisH [Lysobacteraceae bacterium]|nr:MAG: imidazole glycerol phosphate synthase subunit HisH [Xanthomonadaceae bacterium]